LNKLRIEIERRVNYVAQLIAKTRMSPNTLTLLSLVVVVAGLPMVVITRRGLVLAAVVILSGFLDVLDGAVARVLKASTARGALLDSLIDRVCEALYAVYALILGLDPLVVTVFLFLSLITSYLRSRGESLGVSLMGVGLMERAERLIGLVITAIVLEVFSHAAANAVLLVLACLVGVTVIQRTVYIWRNLQH
jgi:archaetidylinositol phosphate synthase